MSFYSLSESERISLTARAVADKKTILQRWNNLGSAEADPWSVRASLAAQFLGPVKSVADLGCGTMLLERHLGKDVRYVPVDVCRRDDRTVVVDFNAEPIPATGAESAACLGLLEYLFDVPGFMASLATHHASAVVTYCVIDAPAPLEPRAAHAWVNAYDRAGLEHVFEAAGWRITQSQAVDDVQMIWALSART